MSKPRVLQVIGDSGVGGGTRVIIALSKFLRAKGLDVYINSSDPVSVRLFEEAYFPVFPVKGMHRAINPFLDLISILYLAKLCRSLRIDVVHTHTSKGGFIGRAAGHIAGVPVIIHTVHGFAFHEFSRPLTVRLYGAIEKLAGSWSNRVVFVNEFHREWAIQCKIISPNKAITVANGIPSIGGDHSRGNSLRQEFDLPPGAKLIGSVGRLATQKGLEYLIEAVPIILQAFPSVFVILVGDGPLRLRLAERAQELGIADNIIFTGFRMSADAIYSEFDLVVLPSLWEGLSISLLEAMRAGKPIVTTTIGSNMTVVKDGHDAVLVQPANSVELANAVIRLLGDQGQCIRLGASARLSFESSFTEDRMLTGYYGLYCDLLADLACESERTIL